MAAKLRIQPAHPRDAAPFGRAAKPEIQVECWDYQHETVEESILDGLAHSAHAWSVWFDGHPAAILGVCRDAIGNGQVWMVTTPAIDRSKRLFLSLCKPFRAALLSLYPRLIAVIDERYATALRWAVRMGCRDIGTVHRGVTGRPYTVVGMGF